MKNITIAEIVTAVEGVFFGDSELLKKNIAGVVIDSRKVEKDFVFVAIKGENVDGHSYAKKAIDMGALCVISEKELFEDVPYILVKSSAKALQDAAKFYRTKLNARIIGITGSVGKTSTKEMISSIVSEKYATHKTIGNYNNELGLPITLFQVEDYHRVVVLEMGISDFGEMHLLADIARPDICVITNIGCCHLETLKDRDGIFKAKSEMFDFVTPDCHIILNGDDDKLVDVHNVKGIKPYIYGIENISADCVASDIKENGLLGSECNISYGEKGVNVSVPIPGLHMVSNACAGYIVGKLLGLTEEEIVRGISKLKPVDGRNNIIKTSRYTVIDDCYNANPVSMKASVDVISGAVGRRVAILGDMFELGENENELHREVGRHICNKQLDLVICVGRLSINIVDEIRNGSKIEVMHFETLEKLLDEVDGMLKENDNVLVKASHGMGFSKLVEVLIG